MPKEKHCKFKNNEKVWFCNISKHKTSWCPLLCGTATVVERKVASCPENPHTYGLNIDGFGYVSWFSENQLTSLEDE